MRLLLLLLGFFLIPCFVIARAAPDDDPEEITSSDFERTRNIGSAISGGHEAFRFKIKKKVTRENQLASRHSQSDRASYFTLKSPDPNWRGELLTIIVSPTPLTTMPVLDKPGRISASMVDTMEDKYLLYTTEYEQQGTEGKSYTKTEKAAGGDGKRQLTQTDPFPIQVN